MIKASSGRHFWASRGPPAGGILARQKDPLVLRRACQRCHPDQSFTHVVMAPAVVQDSGCTRAGTAGQGSGPGYCQESHFDQESPLLRKSTRIARMTTFATFGRFATFARFRPARLGPESSFTPLSGPRRLPGTSFTPLSGPREPPGSLESGPKDLLQEAQNRARRACQEAQNRARDHPRKPRIGPGTTLGRTRPGKPGSQEAREARVDRLGSRQAVSSSLVIQTASRARGKPGIGPGLPCYC